MRDKILGTPPSPPPPTPPKREVWAPAMRRLVSGPRGATPTPVIAARISNQNRASYHTRSSQMSAVKLSFSAFFRFFTDESFGGTFEG